jgi:hypothetical protein
MVNTSCKKKLKFKAERESKKIKEKKFWVCSTRASKRAGSQPPLALPRPLFEPISAPRWTSRPPTNYLDRMSQFKIKKAPRSLAKVVALPLKKGEINHVRVAHDDRCASFHGKPCDCDPEVSVME